MNGSTVFTSLTVCFCLSGWFWKERTWKESSCSPRCGRCPRCEGPVWWGLLLCFRVCQKQKKQPAVHSEVVICSVVTVLVPLPLTTTAPRGRGDAVLLLINHNTLFLCTDTDLTGNNANTETINLPRVLVPDPNHYRKKRESSSNLRIYHLEHIFVVELGAAWGSLSALTSPNKTMCVLRSFIKVFEETFSPLKVSLRRTGCLYWSRHTWHHVSNASSQVHFGAVFSLDGLSFELFYGNGSLSCQDMNEISATLILLIVAVKLIKSRYSPWCYVGDCGL